jgi:hypothetical protein
MFYSISVQVMQFMVIIILLSALGVHEHYMTYLLIFGISSIAANLPISVGGIGIREMVFLAGAEYLHLIPEKSVLISLAFYFISMLVSLPGVIWLHQFRQASAGVLVGQP